MLTQLASFVAMHASTQGEDFTGDRESVASAARGDIYVDLPGR